MRKLPNEKIATTESMNGKLPSGNLSETLEVNQEVNQDSQDQNQDSQDQLTPHIIVVVSTEGIMARPFNVDPWAVPSLLRRCAVNVERSLGIKD